MIVMSLKHASFQLTVVCFINDRYNTYDLLAGSWNGALEVDTFLDHVELLFVMMEGCK
jgi:hypothetical protein